MSRAAPVRISRAAHAVNVRLGKGITASLTIEIVDEVAAAAAAAAAAAEKAKAVVPEAPAASEAADEPEA